MIRTNKIKIGFLNCRYGILVLKRFLFIFLYKLKHRDNKSFFITNKCYKQKI